MTGFDTNVLVRYFVRDDRVQTERADAVIRACTAAHPGFVGMVALVEIVWVLRAYYRTSKADLILILERLLNAHNLVLENSSTIQMALDRFRAAGCDFADCLIECSGQLAGCRRTVTFDRNAAKAAGMKLL